MPQQPYVDPQDLQFGQAAAEKQEKLDEHLESGDADELIEAEEHERHQQGTEPELRAGNKAPPPDVG
jgi:hypothetical protein